MLEFTCFDLDNYGLDFGKIKLPFNWYDTVGTEHQFGDVVYVLIETRIRAGLPGMYFRKKK